jgi:hypothetical protein
MGFDGQRHSSVSLPLGKRLGAHCTGGWMGVGARLDGYGDSHSHRDSNHGP